MMKLNHLSLAVPDVRETAAFMKAFFGFDITANKGNIIIVLENGEGFVLVLTTGKQEDTHYPTDFHFGFIAGSEAEVTAKYEEMLAGGFDIARTPSNIRGSLGFYFHAPGGIMMEVSCNLK